jgi:23S rRNA (guanine2445-N2)-methyltransferase / 23S rRNA (guanine2069-N7)-methyltransferase
MKLHEDYLLKTTINKNKQPLHFLASCPRHCEDILSQEIIELGGEITQRLSSTIAFCGDEKLLYKACLWLRTASSVKLVLQRFEAQDRENLYQKVLNTPWIDHFNHTQTFACETTTSETSFAPSHFLNLVVKDAIADSFRKIGKSRPNVNTDNPHMVISLHMDGTNATLGLELGRALYKRHWRMAGIEQGLLVKSHSAPIKENLSAALLYRAGWPRLCKTGKNFVDPMCGSGTILLEAYAMAYDRAPHLQREFFGFEHWAQFNKTLWQEVLAEATARFEAPKPSVPLFFGYDNNTNTIEQAKHAIKQAGADLAIAVKQADLFQMPAPCAEGLLMSNPPYGQRLGTEEKTVILYQKLGEHLKKYYVGWDVALILPNEDMIRYLDVRTDRLNVFYNGADKRYLARFQVMDAQAIAKPLSDRSQILVKHLSERQDRLGRMAKEHWHTNAYRLYNRGVEAYNAVVDRYDDILVVQTYDDSPAIKDLLRVCREITGLPKSNVLLKKRRKAAAGQNAYDKDQEKPIKRLIHEGHYQIEVALGSYIDTGLYLDHRPLRRWITKEASQKTVLNLFCYTGAVSVAAATGGALSVCSVDASSTYLKMCQHNMTINHMTAPSHTFIRDDVMHFLQHNHGMWDIIYVDPPTYSNGTGRSAFDLQRQQEQLIQLCFKHLKTGGHIYFSTHYQKFRLSSQLEGMYQVHDLTEKSLDADVTQQYAHRLWRIKHK